MSVLVIGKNAFLAQALKQQKKAENWLFWTHEQAVTADRWPDGVRCVINFAYDPVILNGGFSDLDQCFAGKARDIGAHYIMLSSRTVYGRRHDLHHIREGDAPAVDITPYGQAKRDIEERLQAKFADNVTILRLSNVFGMEYRVGHPRRSFFGQMLKSLKEEEQICFDIAPSTCRDFLPLSFFTRSLISIAAPKAGAYKAGVYNLGSGHGISVDAIAKWVLHGYGRGGVVYSDRAKVEDQFILDITKAQNDFDVICPGLADIRRICIEIGQNLRHIP